MKDFRSIILGTALLQVLNFLVFNSGELALGYHPLSWWKQQYVATLVVLGLLGLVYLASFFRVVRRLV